MLYYKAVEPNTLSLLKKLIALPDLGAYALVGGTALALQFGHRKSIDIDLFTTSNFDYNTIERILKDEFGNRLRYESVYSKFGFFCFIDYTKVDIVKYDHSCIRKNSVSEDIRMFSLEDIAAMKIQAILGRGKKKDFYDIAQLFQVFTLEEMIEFHKEKFPSQGILISIPQALSFFDDADESEDPIALKGQNWAEIKLYIRKQIRDYLHG